MSWRHPLTLVLLCALPLLPACASGRQGEDVVRDETITEDREPSAGTGVLVVQNQTSESVDIVFEGDLLGAVGAGENARFPNLPIIAGTVEARSGTGSAVDSDNVDFASAGDATVTFVVDGR